MMNPDPLAASFNASTTFGAYNIGIEITMVLLGVLGFQTHYYFTRFPKDPFWIKFMVATLLYLLFFFSTRSLAPSHDFDRCMEISHAFCLVDSVYNWLIVNYGDPLALFGKTPLSLNLSVFFGGVISPISQSFFAWRLLALSRKWAIPVTCWFLSLLRLSMSLAMLVVAMQMKTLPQAIAQWKWILIVLLAVGCANDITVAACLCYHINRERAHAIRSTARILSQMLEYALQTGIITSIVEITSMITFLKMPDNLIWLSIFTILPRLFSNSLLASLNARVTIQEQQRHIHTTLDLSMHNVMSSHPIHTIAMQGDHATATVDLDSTQGYSSKSTGAMIGLTEITADNLNA